jgi:CRP-like cAMP-binding protein
MEALRPSLVPTELKRNQTVYEPYEPFDKILFPIASIVSVVLDMSDGDTAEVGLVGREGMTGLPIVFGGSSAQQRAIVQVPDSAKYLSVSDLRQAVENEPELKAYSLRYAQAVMNTSAQISACNSLHVTNERCARWLLMAHDRVNDGVLRLTQEFLGQMLGVRRSGVNLAASALQEAGFITYSRGHITIRNRAGLESAACECYDSMQKSWETVMGYSVRYKRNATLSDGQTTHPNDGQRSKPG